MKNLKPIALGLLVGAMAISFSSFTNASRKLAGEWYLPNSSTLVAGTPAAKSFSNYDSLSAQPDPGDCGGTTNVCAAHFPDTQADPTEYRIIDPQR